MGISSDKVSIREKICYGLGDSSANIFLGMTMMFLPYFYTDVLGISAAAMGFLFLAVRLFDAFYDPIIGNIADNTRSKYGRYRPYLLYLAIPYGLSCYLVFLTPDFSPTGKLVFACVSYLFLILMYASTVVPYVGLLTAISSDPAERLSINSYRFPLAKMSFLLCSSLIPMFVARYGKGNEAQGYQTAMILIGVLATIFLLCCFFGTKERNTMFSPDDLDHKKEPLWQQVKLVFHTKPAVYYYLFHMITSIAFTLKGSATIYFVKYYLKQNDAFLSGVLSATAIAGIIAPIISVQLIKHGVFTRLGMVKFSHIVGGIMALLLLVIPQNNIYLCVGTLFGSVLFAELSAIIAWALPADCADYCEVKYNKKMSGILGAGALFALKLGMSIAGALVGWVLAASNYQANTQTGGDMVWAILVLISILPAIFHFMGYMFLRFYTLDDAKMDEIKNELQKRQNSNEEPIYSSTVKN